jgi:uncharacterized protein HemY
MTECGYPVADEHVPRYVAGTLAEAECERFEAHMLECPSCQAAVREAAAIRVGLRQRRRPRLPWVTGVLLAAAAVATVFLIRPTDPIRRLGRVGNVVPGFEGLSVRAGEDAASSLADRGMEAYRNGDFAAAAELLSRAEEGDPTPGLHFFLGITRLQIGDADGAVSALESALEPAGNAYEDEARLYLAKAHLSAGDAQAALDVLVAVDDGADPTQAHARALADSVRAALR